MRSFAHPRAFGGIITLCACVSGYVVPEWVWAQSIDPYATHATLGAPLSLEVRVRHAAAPASMLTPRCIEAELIAGDRLIGPDELQVTLHPDSQPGWQRARLTHHSLLEEPLIQARLTLRCGAPFTREFSVLGDPSEETGEARTQTAKDNPTQRAAPRHRATSTAKVSNIESLPGRVLHAVVPSDQIPAHPVPTPQMTRAAEHLDTPTHAKWLLDELQHLQEEHRRTEMQLASAQARLAHQERESSARAWPWTIGVMCLLLIALGRVAQEAWRSQRPVWRGHVTRRSAPQLPAAMVGPPPAHETTGSQTTSNLSTGIPHDVVPLDTKRRRRWSHADFGEASLDHLPDPEYLRQLENYTAQGYPGATMALVEKSLQASAAKNPWYLLILLDVYSSLGQRTTQEGVAAQLEALYNVQIPDSQGLPSEGRDLLEQPVTLAHVHDCWNDPHAAEAIEALLLHPVAVESLDLAAFRDLVLLHAIARMNTAPDASPADFNPLIDWSSPNG